MRNEVTEPVFAYLYDFDGRVVTLAYTIFKNEILGQVDTTYTAYVGYAICRPDDQHCKASGRRIAEGRMRKLDSRMEVPLGHITRRKDRLDTITKFLCDPRNTVDQYGGQLLSKTAINHREVSPFEEALGKATDLLSSRMFSPEVSYGRLQG